MNTDTAISSTVARLPRMFTLVSLPAAEPTSVFRNRPIAESWTTRNGDISLVVESGKREDGSYIGVPYGIIPMRILAKLAEKVQTGSGREIDLGKSYKEALSILGLAKAATGGVNGTATRAIMQLERLANSRFIWSWSGGQYDIRNPQNTEVTVVDDIAWTFEKVKGRYRIVLSEAMHTHMMEDCVLLKQEHLDALGRDVLATQVYAWLADNAYRGRELEVFFGVLRDQFGVRCKKSTRFTQKLTAAIEKVKKVWPEVNVSITPGIDARKPDDGGKRGARLAGYVSVGRCEPPVARSKAAVARSEEIRLAKEDAAEAKLKRAEQTRLETERFLDADGLTKSERAAVEAEKRAEIEAAKARQEAEAAEEHRLWKLKDDEDRRLGRGIYHPDVRAAWDSEEIPF